LGLFSSSKRRASLCSCASARCRVPIPFSNPDICVQTLPCFEIHSLL
jgi:hypothetical protein